MGFVFRNLKKIVSIFMDYYLRNMLFYKVL
ncbi:Uncharacterized protein XB16_0438 [Leptospira santarosai]|uniref:Uncharacterized protein n=1 Tax=Leptospira santarosai TaxID=28183 RepID=A0A2P1QPG7_9LEPT|nr:Uncharacterized protein XB16_0438 [Leptospira santarosai]